MWTCDVFFVSLKDVVKSNDPFMDQQGVWGFGSSLEDLVRINDSLRDRQGLDDVLKDLMLPFKSWYDLMTP